MIEQRCQDPARRAARLVIDGITEAVRKRRRARVAIPGGSALAAWEHAYAELEGALGDGQHVEVDLTWIDERCVPHEDPQSNYGIVLRSIGFARMPAPLPLFVGGESPPDAIARVRRQLASRFENALDVVLLGLGEDGHVASLFPGRDADGDRVVHVADSPKPPPNRITLTRALLTTAPCAILVAIGEGKRAALARLIANDPSLPATGWPGLVIVTDLDMEARPGGGPSNGDAR